jgi:hypothetical protein
MCAMLGWLNDASTCASRRKRAIRSVSPAKRPQDFDRDVTVQLRIAGTVHLAHAAGADDTHDLVNGDLRARRQGYAAASL